MRTSVALPSLLIVGILLLAACASAEETDARRLIPAGSSLIGEVRVAEILEDSDFAILYGGFPKSAEAPQALDALLDRGIQRIGIDLRQLSNLVFFGDLSRLNEFVALIVPGSFEEEVLVEALESSREGTLSAVDYKGRKVHADREGNIAFSVMGGDILVLGTDTAVRAVIDVQEGDAERASGRVYDTFTDQEDALVRLALAVPPNAVKRLGRFGGDTLGGLGGLALASLEDLEIVGFTVDKDGKTLRAVTQLDFNSESSAAEVRGTFDGLVKVLRGLVPNERIKRLLDDVQVSVDEERLTVRAKATVTELEESIGTLEGRFLELPALFRLPRRLAPPGKDIVPRAHLRPRPPGFAGSPVPGVGRSVPIVSSGDIPFGEAASYSTIPPTSGPHWRATAQCGVHQDELPDELIVQNLERGHVVISYNLPEAEEVRTLREVVERLPSLRDFRSWGILRPYSKIEPGAVAMTAWGVIDEFEGVDKERIGKFYDAYRGNRLSERSRRHGPVPCR